MNLFVFQGCEHKTKHYKRYIHNMITETVSMRICENQVEKIRK